MSQAQTDSQKASVFLQKIMGQANTHSYGTASQINGTASQYATATNGNGAITQETNTTDNTNNIPSQINSQPGASNTSDTTPNIINNRVISHPCLSNDIQPVTISYDNNIAIEWRGIDHVIPTAYHKLSRRSDSIDIENSALREEKKLDNEHPHYESWTERAMKMSSGSLFAVAESGEALAYAAAGYGAAIAATVGVGLLASVSEHGYTKYLQWEADDQYTKKENYNSKVALLNNKIDIAQEIMMKVEDKKNKLMKQEAMINKIEFVVERSFVNAKVIVAIGPTGYGKSLFCNRMIGNQKDIESISESENEVYTVAEEGDTQAQTTEIQKTIREVTIVTKINRKNKHMDDDSKLSPLMTEGSSTSLDNINSEYIMVDTDKDKDKNENKVSESTASESTASESENVTKVVQLLSVVDTQGAFDTNNNDKLFQNQMAEYFRACGGVNMFCIFFKFKNKIDSNYQRLLKQYETFWGKHFWKHCVVIITNCDIDTNSEKQCIKLNKKLSKFTIPQVKEFLKNVSNGQCTDVAIFCYGESNYMSSTSNILQTLALETNVFAKKYKCQNIICPMDVLWEELQIIFKQYKKVLTEVKELRKEVEMLKKDMKAQPLTKKTHK